MKDGYQFRAYPTLQQVAILLRWIGCQRFIYNSKVGENRYFRAFAGKFLSNTGLFAPIDQQYRQFKSELTPWLDEVPCQVLRNGAYKWAQAYQRYFKGFGGRPVFKRKHGKQSVWLTKELFEFIEFTNPTTQRKELKLRIGTQKYPVGILEFTAHRDFKIPASIHLSVHGGRWSISFNADTERVEPDEAQTLAALKMLSAEELTPLTLGLDRGVTVPLVGSDRQKWDISAAQQRKINQQERYKKRWQRRLARRVKGSGRSECAKRRVARASLYAADVRKDFAHQTSHRIVAGSHSLFVFEDLKVKQMTASARGTAAEPGQSVAQKAGLNRSILASAWGQIKLFTHYKARRAGKLCIVVPPHYSSQTCAPCQHTAAENRLIQSEFLCQRCGYQDDADINAATVLAQRGVAAILSGAIVIKEKKRASIRKKVGVECSEPVEAISPTCVETVVSRRARKSLVLRSRKRETLTTTAAAV
jgi:putative transposase